MRPSVERPRGGGIDTRERFAHPEEIRGYAKRGHEQDRQGQARRATPHQCPPTFDSWTATIASAAGSYRWCGTQIVVEWTRDMDIVAIVNPISGVGRDGVEARRRVD